MKIQMRAQNKSATIEINGTIGGGMFDEDSVTAKGFIGDLKQLGDVDEIHLNIYSGGGSVIEGNAIFHALAQHPAKVIAHIDFAASMASIIAMSADEIHMAENGFLMIHNPWSYVVGDANELRHTAELLDKMKASAVSAYQRHAKLSDVEIEGMMDHETWMTAEEAKDFGFIHEITAAVSIAATVKVDDASNAPEGAKAFIESIEAQNEPQETITVEKSKENEAFSFSAGKAEGLAEAETIAKDKTVEAVARVVTAEAKTKEAEAALVVAAEALEKAESQIESMTVGFEYSTDTSKNVTAHIKDHEFFKQLEKLKDEGLTQIEASAKLDEEQPQLRISMIQQANQQ